MTATIRIMRFILLACCLFAYSKQEDTIVCSKNVLEQLDKYLEQIEVVPNGKRRFPETIAELHEGCRLNKQVMSLMNQMANKCLNGFNKNVLLVSLYSIKKSQRSLCRSKPTKDMRKFVAAGKCVNSGRPLFRKCFDETLRNVYSVKQVEVRKRVPLICCEIVRAKRCLLAEVKNVKECTEEHVNTINNRFNHVSMNAMDIACGDFNEDTDRCDRVLPPEGPKTLPNKSMVMTFFDVMESLNVDDIGPANL